MDGDDEANGRGWELVAAGVVTAYDGNDFSVFPPSLHEGLTPTLTLSLDSPSTSTSSSIEGHDESEQEEKEEEAVAHVRRTRISESARRLVSSGMELIRCKFAALKGGLGGGSNGGAVWSFVALAGFAGVLMYIRRRHRREKELLLFLILEKDERINQLMDQIVKMSEAITASYKVPVAMRN